jgi:hypothetical protein
VCMFVLGILSLWWRLSYCINSYPTDYDHGWHLWVVSVVPGGIWWIGYAFYIVCNEYLVKF